MRKSTHVLPRAAALACLCALLLPAAAPARAPQEGAQQQQPANAGSIRLRSLTTRATGQLNIEPSESGGRARLTALNLPDPATVAPGATLYVVWAVGGGRVARLGVLRADERGNGGLAFDRPAEFERYGVIVTAERDASVERPGDPVLATRAGEAAALYPEKTTAATPRSAAPPALPRPRRASGGGFYAEVDGALAARGGGRLLDLQGEEAAPGARGAARAASHTGSAYVRADFRNVPLPPAVGASVYVLWAITPDGRIVYMGSLPADQSLNDAEIYVRTAGFDSDDFDLMVTAERQRPAPGPSARRVLSSGPANRVIVK